MTELRKMFPESEVLADSGILFEGIKIFKSKNVALITLKFDETIEDLDFFKDEIKNLFSQRLDHLKIEIDVMENSDGEDIPIIINNYLIRNCGLKHHNFRLVINENVVKLIFLDYHKPIELDKLEFILTKHGYSLETEFIDSEEVINNFIESIEEEELELSEITLENTNNTTIKDSSKQLSDSDDERYITHGKVPKKETINLKLSEVNMESGLFSTSAVITKIDYKKLKDRDVEICSIYVTDYVDSNCIKLFLEGTKIEKYTNKLKPGDGIYIIGELQYDTFNSANFIKARYFKTYENKIPKDNFDDKRVELHLHTKMSTMDGLTNISDYVKRAKYWGHEAIAITDHAGIQGFPDAMKASKAAGIKMIYGVEAYIVDDLSNIIKHKGKISEKTSFVVFDVETTGFSNLNDRIIEIGAVRIENGVIADSFGTLVNPEISIPEDVVKLTNISDNMVSGAPKIEEIFPKFHGFIKDSILVAHNAAFDIGFVKRLYDKMNQPFDNPYIDTLEISRIKTPNVKSHRLKDIAKRLNISLVNAHRAVDDARATAEIFLSLLSEEFSCGSLAVTLESIERLKLESQKQVGNTFHALLLVKNYTGLKNLYKLISKSNLEYFYYTPRIPKSELIKMREGLLLGSACSEGELVQSIIYNEPFDRVKEIASFYDFLEIQPTANNMGLIDEGYFNDSSQLKDLNLQILQIGDLVGKPVVATGDAHFIDEHLRESRNILKKSIKKSTRGEYDVSNYFRSTEEMMEEFTYLGSRAREIVIDNSKKISNLIEEILPIPEGTYPPEIEGSNEELVELTYGNAHMLYGEELPLIVKERIEVELTSIIKHGYSVLYIIAQKLVKKSNEDGYQVGSRGSVGSSLVATMCGITEVNPLPPHYNCPSCHHTEFIDVKESGIFSGTDLPAKKCPKCGHEFKRYGDDIPFEVFLGFDGDKEPDIDLNFAGEYQSIAHKYTEELFGEGYVFRAGTIGTVAEKTAYGYVKSYYTERDIVKSNAEIDRIVGNIIGVKRTTGQHAGGVMIVPKNKEIYDFTPIQYPAEDSKAGVITTHYDYESISGKILKLDILGHDVPTMIKMIESMTDTNFLEVPLNDEKVISIFSSSKELNLKKEIFDIEVGTLGVPEFGTKFVRKMLKSTTPTTFAELVRISGLSHGTNVWTGNAEELVASGDATLKEVISTREDIMSNLLHAGAEKKFAFNIMEKVRKGKGITEEEEKHIREFKLPKWYVDSCNKISYMFPKAHAVAYVTMSVRLAYYKVYYPLAFYATYLSTKLSNFNFNVICNGPQAIREKISSLSSSEEISKKEIDDLNIYDIALEIYARGLEFGDLDLYKSDAGKFKIIDNKIIPPLQCVSNLGENVANAIISEREIEPFLSIEDLVNRTKITKSSIEHLRSIGLLNNLSETNQLSFI